MMQIPSFTLNNGQQMPAMGCGTWLRADIPMPEVQVQALGKCLDVALERGFRHIDVGTTNRVEEEVGAVLVDQFYAGELSRDQVTITAKIRNYNHREADVEPSVRATLRRLGLYYLDFVIMGFPISTTLDRTDACIDYLETWRGMEGLLKKGLARSLGVANFNLEQMQRLLRYCRVRPVCNQVEVNLNLAQEDLVNYCSSNNIRVVATYQFGTGIPPPEAPIESDFLLYNETLSAIAKKHNRHVWVIMLRYLYQRGIVTNPMMLAKFNVAAFASVFAPGFLLDEEDLEAIRCFDIGYRTCRALQWQPFLNYPFARNH